MKAVREYGLEGVRIQNVSDLAGISPGALYRHFNSKDQLIEECFTYVDKQAAEIFEHLKFNPVAMAADPVGTVKSLWLPYFRFWWRIRMRRYSIIDFETAPFSRNIMKPGTRVISAPSSVWYIHSRRRFPA